MPFGSDRYVSLHPFSSHFQKATLLLNPKTGNVVLVILGERNMRSKFLVRLKL